MIRKIPNEFFPFNFNFSNQIKSLFIFSVLTNFSFIFNLNFSSRIKFVYFRRFGEFFPSFSISIFHVKSKVCLFSGVLTSFFPCISISGKNTQTSSRQCLNDFQTICCVEIDFLVNCYIQHILFYILVVVFLDFHIPLFR